MSRNRIKFEIRRQWRLCGYIAFQRHCSDELTVDQVREYMSGVMDVVGPSQVGDPSVIDGWRVLVAEDKDRLLYEALPASESYHVQSVDPAPN